MKTKVDENGVETQVLDKEGYIGKPQGVLQILFERTPCRRYEIVFNQIRDRK